MSTSFPKLEGFSLHLELITRLEQFEALQSDWNALLHYNATNEIFLTWEWQRTWWQFYHPGTLWVITARNETGQLVGIEPRFLDQPDLAIRPIRYAQANDYLDITPRPY